MNYLISSFFGIIFGIIFLFSAVAMFVGAEVPSAGESGYILGQIARFLFSGIFLVSGLVFFIPGVRAFADLPRRARLLRELKERGIKTTAVITFIDRNFSLKVNGNYVYTIVEYEYKDHHGIPQSHRLPRIPSEIIIRQKYEVGSTINIVYHPDRPEKSGWLELQQYIDENLEA
ncbi:MAG: hypothetical protein RLP44_27815 [Aggregatilineales bacterium]